jgi:hypothetical protein
MLIDLVSRVCRHMLLLFTSLFSAIWAYAMLYFRFITYCYFILALGGMLKHAAVPFVVISYFIMLCSIFVSLVFVCCTVGNVDADQ